MNNDYIVSLLEAQNSLLTEILEVLSTGIHVKREGNDRKYAAATPLSQQDYDSLDEEIDLDWWYSSFGEEPHPAKYMNRSGSPFSKQEMDYMFRRLMDIASVRPPVNDGTHTFIYAGKIYSKIDKNTFNCFQCVPAK